MVAASVLIADTNLALAGIIGQLLNDEREYRVVEITDTGASALIAARRHRPDVVLVDPQLKDTSGRALCAALRAATPATAVLLWSHDTSRAGEWSPDVDGVLERGMTFRQLVQALDMALAGARRATVLQA